MTTVPDVNTEDALLQWVQGTTYYRRRVRSPEWWRSLTPDRRVAEFRRVHRRMRIWYVVINVYLGVLLLCTAAVTAFFVDPSVASVVFGLILLILLLGVTALIVWTRRRCRRTLRQGREHLRQLEAAAMSSSRS